MNNLEQTREWVEARRKNRAAAREAHDNGNHGNSEVRDVVEYWAALCADCKAVCDYNGWKAAKK